MAPHSAKWDQARRDEEYAELLHGDEPDAVGETVAQYTERNPRFAALMEDARSRRRLLRRREPRVGGVIC